MRLAARAWLTDHIDRQITENGIDVYRQDFNFDPLPYWQAADTPNRQGISEIKYIEGLYSFWDELLQRHPNLIIENCASGGNRMDYALMRRTDIAWLSDETDPSYRVRYHMAGASYPFPPEYLNTWLIDSASEPLADTTDPATLRSWLRSRMMGAFGISADLVAWSPELRAVAAIEIEQYKKTRQMIANSRLYRLLPQTELKLPDTSAGESLEPPASPDAAEFINPMGDTGAVFLFRGAVPWSQRRVTLKGMEPDMLYQVTSADRTMSLRRTGQELMTQGIRFRYNSAHPSTLLFFQPAATDAPADAPPGN